MKTSALSLFLGALSSPVVSAATAGCRSDPSTIQEGLNTVTINGKPREWILTLPKNYDNCKPYRFIFGVHWRSGTMNDVAYGGEIDAGNTLPYFGLQELADESAIFVAPQGLISNGSTGWANIDGEDIEFMKTLVETTSQELCIDENLRFSVGYSYGAAMTHSIACTFGKQFRAVAALSGALLSGCEDGDEPVAWYGQHGNNDALLPIERGEEIRNEFVKRNGCTHQDTETPAIGSNEHILTKFEGCADDKPLWWVAFDGIHSPIPTDGGNDGDDTFTGPYVWEFFSQFD